MKLFIEVEWNHWDDWEDIEILAEFNRQQDLPVQDADYEPSASYACQKSWTISSTEQ